ncbi:hypothetical protein AAE478_007584 [Parahypoxylon ruwenzoriense]
MSSFTTLRPALRARTLVPNTARLTAFTAARQMHQSAAPRVPYKDDMDRESLKPKSHEYTQSGTDEAVATKKDASFNPHKTDPDTEKEAAAAESNGNPLEDSPANKDFAEAGRGHEEDKPHIKQKKASSAGNAPKSGRVA